MRWTEREIIYLSLHCYRQNDLCIKVFINCDGQSHKTVSTDHNVWRERRAKADSNRGPSAYQPNALSLGQTGSRSPLCTPNSLASSTPWLQIRCTGPWPLRQIARRSLRGGGLAKTKLGRLANDEKPAPCPANREGHIRATHNPSYLITSPVVPDCVTVMIHVTQKMDLYIILWCFIIIIRRIIAQPKADKWLN